MSNWDKALAEFEALLLEDVVVKNSLRSFSPILEKIRRLEAEYNRSEYPKELSRIWLEKYEKAYATKVLREKKRAEWCAKYLKVGDWVRVTGTSTNKYRKIMTLHKHDFDNIQGNPLTGETRAVVTTTSYEKVTEVLNPLTRIMEKINVSNDK